MSAIPFNIQVLDSIKVKCEMFTRGGQYGRVVEIFDKGVTLEFPRDEGREEFEFWEWGELEVGHLAIEPDAPPAAPVTGTATSVVAARNPEEKSLARERGDTQ